MINLLHGDCLELMKKIPDKSIDMILTDPPYQTTQCKWDIIIPFEPMWIELKRIIKDNGAICLFGSEPFSSALRMSNLKMYKYDWIWDKVKPNGHLNAKKQPLVLSEQIMVFGNGRVNYLPIMEKRDKVKTSKVYSVSAVYTHTQKIDINTRIYSHRYPKNHIKISNASQKNRTHPTQKPIPLLEYLIKTYTLENETVLDFTMGSGSTGVACKNLNRSFIGIEKDDKYFEIAKNRINND